MGRRPGRGGMLHGTDRLRAPARGGIWEHVNTGDLHALCIPWYSVQRARCISACAYTQTGPNRSADIQPCPQPKAQCWRNFKSAQFKD